MLQGIGYMGRHGKTTIDEETKNITFVTNFPGYKTEHLVVTFDQIKEVVQVEAYREEKSSVGFELYICNMLEELTFSPHKAHMYHHIYPYNYNLEDGVLTINFSYFKYEPQLVSPSGKKPL